MTHGTVDILPHTEFPVRNGFHFQVAVASLDPHLHDNTVFLQLGFGKVYTLIQELKSQVDTNIPVRQCMTQGSHADLPISTTIVPPLRTGTPANSFAFQHFHTALQSLWQPQSASQETSGSSYDLVH